MTDVSCSVQIVSSALTCQLSAGTSILTVGITDPGVSVDVQVGQVGPVGPAGPPGPGGGLTVSAGDSSNSAVSTLVFANSNGVSFGLSNQTVTASVVGLSQSTQPLSISAANGLYTSNVLALGNSNGVSFSTGSQGVYANVKTDYLTTAAPVDITTNNIAVSQSSLFQHVSNTSGIVSDRAFSTHSHGNPTLNLTNLSGTTASGSNGLTLSLSVAAGGGGADGYNIVGVNGATVGSAATIQLSNSNNVSFGISGSTITASASYSSQTVQTQGLVSLNGQTGALSLNVGSSLSSSVNGKSTTFGLASNITTALQPSGAYLTTAALSAHSHGVTLNLTNLSGSTGGNSAGINLSLSAPSQVSADWNATTGVAAIQNKPNTDILRFGLATGILKGGNISVNGTTLLDVAAGQSIYVDFSDIDNPIIETLSWSSQTVDPALSSTRTRLWIGIQRTAPGVGSIVFADEFTATQKRTIAVLGRVWGTGTATIEGVGKYSTPGFYAYNTLVDLIDTLGAINKDGNVFSPNGANLLLDKSSGHSFRFSADFENTPISPNIHEDASQTGITAYHYHIYNDQDLLLQSEIDPNYYDVDGVRTTVPIDKFTIQRIHFYPKSGVVDVLYGQHYYDTLELAKASIFTETVNIDSYNLKSLSGSVLRGYIVVKQGCAALNNPAQCSIIAASNMGAGTSSSGFSGITDHGELLGLGDDDHPQYLKTALSSNLMASSERGNYYFTSNNTFANGTHSHGATLNLTNINGTTGGGSAGINLSLSAVVPAQTVQTQGMVSLNGQTGALSLGVGSSLSSSINGKSTTFGLASNITTALQSAGAYLTTAMASNASTAFAGTGSGFSGNSISATITHNTLGLSLNLNHPAWLTTAMQSQLTSNYMSTAERANYFATAGNTFANLTHVHGNPTLNLTNISGTTASNSAGLTLSLSAAAPGGGGAIRVSAGTSSADVQTLVFSNSNGVSFGLNGSTITGSAAAGAGGGIAIGNSQTTYTNGTVSLSAAGALTIASSTGQIMQMSVPAVSVLAGTNVTIGTTGSTIGISAAAPGAGGSPERRYIEIMQGERLTSCAALSATQWSNRPIIAPFWMDGTGLQAKTVQFMMSGVGSSNRSLGCTLHAGIYKCVSDTQLSLVTSDSMSFSITASSQSTQWNGMNIVQFTGMSDYTATDEGRYAVALMVAPVSANATWMSMQLYGGDVFPAISRFLVGNTTSATNNTRKIVPFWGVYSTTTGAMPTTIADTQINGGNSASLADPYVVIKEI